ncbi:MAG: CocE/NonD family hydrolase, partial [Pseudomonadota bacterium]
NTCCLADALPPGSFDQRPVESRADVLVYRSEPLAEPVEVSGPVFVTLYVSSDAKDTDFTVKLVDIDTDGAAWNLDESIKRVRYRNGYQRPELMQAGEVYELELGPLITSNVFEAGHRIGIEVSSSSFPRFERNLNTGGINARETEAVSAVNAVHFGPSQASRIVLTVSK